MRKLLALIFSIVFLASLSLVPANAADIGGDGQIQTSAEFRPPMTPGYIGYSVYGALSIQAGLPTIFNGKRICAQPDTACLGDATLLNILPGYFKHCTQTTNSPCIEKLEARLGLESPWTEASFKREISYASSSSEQAGFVDAIQRGDPGSRLFEAGVGIGWDYQPGTGLPASAAGPLLFDLPGFSNAGGTTSYVIDARYEVQSAVISGKVESASFGNLNLSIRPTSVTSGAYNTPVRGRLLRADGTTGVTGTPGGNIDRTFETSSEKGEAKAFGDQNAEFRLTVVLPKSTVGWFHGRIIDPSIDIQKANESQIRVAISGKPTMAPVASVWLPAKAALEKDPNLMNPNWFSDLKLRMQKGESTSGDEWNSWGGLDERFQAWVKYLPQKAQGFANLWMINTLPAQQTSSRCFDNAGQLVGLLTTNSMAYQAGAPQFNNGFLDYKVSGVHLDYKGQVYSGTYDLIIRSDVARCLYGFNQTPISATISVIDTEQGASTATTTMTESAGWVRFAAKNFTFSTKEVRVKISQPKYQTLTGFAKGKSAVSPAMKTAIKRTITSAVGGTYTCVGYYSKASSKSLAKARATAACAVAKSVNLGLATEVLTYSTTNTKLDASVQVARR